LQRAKAFCSGPFVKTPNFSGRVQNAARSVQVRTKRRCAGHRPSTGRPARQARPPGLRSISGHPTKLFDPSKNARRAAHSAAIRPRQIAEKPPFCCTNPPFFCSCPPPPRPARPAVTARDLTATNCLVHCLHRSKENTGQTSITGEDNRQPPSFF
jgi:hypothetical protein